MKLAVHIGGNSAASMFGCMGGGRDAAILQKNWGTIAATANILHQQDGDVVATVGTPIRPIDPSRIDGVRSAGELLSSQDGAFASIFWCEAEQKLVVVTDFLGMKPLYMMKRPGELLLATETKAWQAEPDPAGWGAFVSFGHTVGDGTLLNGVERVRPGTVLIYDVSSDRATEHRYWQWPSPKSGADLGGLVDALKGTVRAYADYGNRGQLLLSGGFDSRLVLCLLKAEDIPVSALIVNHPDEVMNADGSFARAMACQFSIPFQCVDSSKRFFSSSGYIDYLNASDAATPSLYLFISQIAQFIEAPAIWEGLIPGCTLTTLHQPAGGFASYLQQECRDIHSSAWQAAQTIFRRDFYTAMLEGFQAKLQEEIAHYSDDGYGVTEFIVRNRSRNRTAINPLKVFEAKSRVYLPGMSRDFFDIAGSISYDIRKSNSMYLELLRKFFPAALSFPIISGGALIKPSILSMSYYRYKIGEIFQQLAARYPTVFRRLHGGTTAAGNVGSSCFLQLPLLVDDSDPYINIDCLHRLVRDAGGLPTQVSKLLFHWRMWNEVHAQRLQETLGPYAI